MNRNQLYILLLGACLAGYSWLFIAYEQWLNSDPSGLEVCLFKQLTTVPCPSCGSTRSVVALLNGNLIDSVLYNPFGLLIFLFLLITPFWLLHEVVFKQSTLFTFYRWTEQFLIKKRVAIPAILLVVANWIWNICKSL